MGLARAETFRPKQRRRTEERADLVDRFVGIFVKVADAIVSGDSFDVRRQVSRDAPLPHEDRNNRRTAVDRPGDFPPDDVVRGGTAYELTLSDDREKIWAFVDPIAEFPAPFAGPE